MALVGLRGHQLEGWSAELPKDSIDSTILHDLVQMRPSPGDGATLLPQTGGAQTVRMSRGKQCTGACDREAVIAFFLQQFNDPERHQQPKRVAGVELQLCSQLIR